MKVIIKRTSVWDDSKSPIEGAKQETLTRYDYRNSRIKNNTRAWDDFTKVSTDIEQLPDGRWRGKFRTPDTVWTIDIADIYEFVKQIGEEVIISKPGEYAEGYFIVEIYDDYRE